jgi:hypothetical protein
LNGFSGQNSNTFANISHSQYNQNQNQNNSSIYNNNNQYNDNNSHHDNSSAYRSLQNARQQQIIPSSPGVSPQQLSRLEEQVSGLRVLLADCGRAGRAQGHCEGERCFI